MKIGDPVYLITDQLQTGAGIPGMICALQDSKVEVVVEFSDGPKILKLRNWEDHCTPKAMDRVKARVLP